MKSNMSAEQASAIQRFINENGAVPQLSKLPIVRFRIKSTGNIVERNINDLVSHHLASKEEERKMRAQEKRREESQRWRPITGKW